MRGQGGMGLIELLIVLVVVAVAGGVLYSYFGSTARTLEQVQQQRPTDHARLAADQMTLSTVRTALQVYQAQNGRWPPDRDAVLGLLAGPPRFQCAGNDFDYDAASGAVRLRIDDAARCVAAP